MRLHEEETIPYTGTTEVVQQPAVEASANQPQPQQFATPPNADRSNQIRPVDTQKEPEIIQWEASEFVDHQKNSGWFLLLGGGAIVASALIYLMTKSIFSVAVVLLAAAAFGMTAKQKPRILRYSLFPTSLRVGDKNYSYNDFRTFSVIQDGAMSGILLQPLKRFMPSLTIYFPQEDGAKIFDTLAAHIPHEEHKDDSIDRFMKQIRF